RAARDSASGAHQPGNAVPQPGAQLRADWLAGAGRAGAGHLYLGGCRGAGARPAAAGVPAVVRLGLAGGHGRQVRPGLGRHGRRPVRVRARFQRLAESRSRWAARAAARGRPSHRRTCLSRLGRGAQGLRAVAGPPAGAAMNQALIRNFCIIAHIDHGKSTLADRLLERTGTISSRDMAEQVLDSMDLEREKGITIKAQAVRMGYRAADGKTYELNLIDTPGHVDFTYEVSRSLAACEGAIVVVDAAQGIEAQTLANVYLAMEHDLKLIPVINKIDLPSAEPERVAHEIERVLGLPEEEIIFASAKEGRGTEAILEAVVQRIPPPRGSEDQPLRALIFDSHYDVYKGVIAYVRVVDGIMSRSTEIELMSTGRSTDVMEIGFFSPRMRAADSLAAGEVGYIATGLKNVKDCRVGDTVTDADSPAREPLPGYQPAKPMVFAGFYPTEGDDYPLLRDALERLQLNDAALSFQPETSQALGFGFRCGFLGMLHMQIIQERLEREYELDLLATAPSVEYQVVKQNGALLTVDNPAQFPNFGEILEIREPWMDITIISPSRYIGAI